MPLRLGGDILVLSKRRKDTEMLGFIVLAAMAVWAAALNWSK